MTDEFSEHRSVNASEPLRQGDVLESVDSGASKWQQYLLVITADCDFAHQKHHGRVTCVPFLPVSEYLLELHLPRYRERLARKQFEEVTSIIKKLQLHSLSETRLREWLLEEESDKIAAALDLCAGERDRLIKSVLSYQRIHKDSQSLRDACNNLIEGQKLAYQSVSEKNARDKLQSFLQNAFSSPPGDAIFISSIAPQYDNGYFVYLRHLEQVWEREIGLVTSHTNKSYRRLARLQDRYTLAIVQRFASVFSSIGLPTEYENTRDFYSELTWEEIS